MTLLPESIRHYLPVIIAVQIVLFASAILVGGFLIIRRLARRPPIEGQILEEKEKLAAEIHTEIMRLRELRDRLHDGYGEGAEPQFKTKAVQQSPATAPIADAANEELKKTNQDLQEKLEALRKEITELKARLAAAPAVNSAPSGAAAPTEEIKKAIEAEVGEKIRGEFKDKMTQQETTIKDLSNRLEEYEIFEEELAQIKKYKQENDQLKQQVSSGAAALPEGFSENDIAQLFNEMSVSNAEGALASVPVGTPPPENAPGPSLEALAEAFPTAEKTVIKETPREEPAIDASPMTEGSLDEELEKMMAASANQGSTPAAEPAKPAPVKDKEFVAEKTAEEPDVMSVDNENAEAMAMLGSDQDELMKEFEKVLAPTTKEK